jgi:hypothetical protein
MAALCAVALLACGADDQEAPVVARVGDAVLTVEELNSQVPDVELGEDLRRLYVEDWIQQQLLYHEALDRELHEKPLVRRLVEQARQDLIVAAYLDGKFENDRIDIAETELENYYHLHADDYTRQEDEIRAQHILIGSRRDAETLRQELLSGDSFEARVQELSLDRETLSSGGDLGYFTAEERPVLWEACLDLRPGQISRPVVDASGRGHHIARLLDRKAAGSLRSLDEAEVRKDIEEALVRERYRARVDSLVDRLRDEHSWQIDEDLLAAP